VGLIHAQFAADTTSAEHGMRHLNLSTSSSNEDEGRSSGTNGEGELRQSNTLSDGGNGASDDESQGERPLDIVSGITSAVLHWKMIWFRTRMSYHCLLVRG
jgi:hypothetical protein